MFRTLDPPAPAPTAALPLAQRFGAVLRFLPRGGTLPEDVWRHRHRVILIVLWLHVPALLAFGLWRGLGGLHGTADVLPVAVLALGATMTSGARRRASALMAAFGLLTSSALLVHLWAGQIEAHFHFFVVVALLALYEDWAVFLAAIAYVGIQHGLVGLLAPDAVYQHASGAAHPVRWAGVHAAFVGALSAVCLASWRLNEDVRERERRAHGLARASGRRAEAQAGTLAAIAGAAHRISANATWQEARPAICVAAREVCGADAVVLYEPDAEGEALVATGRAGAAGDAPVALDLADHAAPAVAAFLDSSRRYSAGYAASERDDPAARLILWQPVLREPHRYGVLCAIWHAPEAQPLNEPATVLAILAADAAAVIERAELLARLEDVARTDVLTALPNRRAWDEELPRQLSRAGRESRALSVALLDLDHFKRYNDRHGHPAGDRLLKEVAGGWRSALRLPDFLARYGGEEFALILPSCELAEAGRLADRLREAMPSGTTCSIGVAQWNGSESGDDLLDRADRALYAAKAGGRDAVALAPAPPGRGISAAPGGPPAAAR